MKITLLEASHPNMSEREIEISADRILCNDIVLPWENHPHKVKLWAIGNEYGCLGIVWADCEQDALDTLVDAGLGDGLLIEEADADARELEGEEFARLGNAGEPACLDYAWMQPVRFNPALDCQLIALFAEARGMSADNLDDGRLPFGRGK